MRSSVEARLNLADRSAHQAVLDKKCDWKPFTCGKRCHRVSHISLTSAYKYGVFEAKGINTRRTRSSRIQCVLGAPDRYGC